MPSVISGDANVSATEFGFLDGVTSSLQSQIDAKLPLAGGKILQIVRATDTTARSTTSTSFVDVPGMSVTITPQKSDSALLIIAAYTALTTRTIDGSLQRGDFQISDSSNNALSGAQLAAFGITAGSTNAQPRAAQTLIGYVTPATTSAVTYKLRFRVASTDTTMFAINDVHTGQMYAIEVSA